jgi:putative hemolysin
MLAFFIILISLLFSFFFSGMEIAYVSSDKMQIHVESQQEEGFASRLFSRITTSPIRFLVTLLLGNTLALVVFGVFTADLLADSLRGHSLTQFEILVIQTIVTTGVVLVVADFIPKSLFRISPNRLLKLFALPCILIYYILLPFTSIVLAVAQFMTTKLFGESLLKNKSTFTKKDLFSYLDLHEHDSAVTGRDGEQQEVEVQMFKNALMFPNVKVRDCMVSRLDIIGSDINEGAEKLKEKFLQTGLSRILIYNDNLDNVLGYVHYHEIFKNSSDIRSLLLPAPVIPESMPAKDALRTFMQQRKSMAAVVDEFGVISGILTTEDIIEEIFGEIEDEYDKEEQLEKELSPGEYLFSARLEIDYLNQKYQFNLPASPNYTTLAGFILHETGSIPKAKQHINIGNFQFRIVSATATRVEQVYLIAKKAPADFSGK